MSNVNPDSERGTHNNEAVQLLDCGCASKVTRGYIYFLQFELSWPPFDRQLVM